jgi:DNA-binding PucR family transcriptional regulator
LLTVKSLTEELGLELTAGEGAADAPVRWVHITELLDPTPWLNGGELLLTTGLQLGSASQQTKFLRLLADHSLAGLGFGVGFEHERIPPALVKQARELDFPLFEVPFEMPFIAITEKAFGRLVNEQYETLQRGVALHKRLEQLVLEERGLEEVTRALAAAIGGSVVVLDRRGAIMASSQFRRELAESALTALQEEVSRRSSNGPPMTFAPEDPSVSGRALALPVAASDPEGPQAWLVAVADSGGLAEYERLIVQQAVTVVALELMRRRVVRDTERRLAGDVLAEVLSGAVDVQEIESRLRPFGVGKQAVVLLFDVDDAVPAQAALDALISDAGGRALVATREDLLCAIVDPAGVDPMQLAAAARDSLSGRFGQVRAAAGRFAPVTALRRSFHEARCALEVSAMNGEGPEIASYSDLGAFQFLLSIQDDEALRIYSDSVLGPISDGEGEYGDELLRSLEAFLEQNGHWERAAKELFCHRHTLRYRIKRIEELTGRDLGRARDRIEFWLALRARELTA